MLLSGALFALFMTGFWLYCLTDAILTPASECRGMSKPAWIVVIIVTFIGGAVAWLIVRQPVRSSSGLLAPMPLGPGPGHGLGKDPFAPAMDRRGQRGSTSSRRTGQDGRHRRPRQDPGAGRRPGVPARA